jgi:hypothetical protein
MRKTVILFSLVLMLVSLAGLAYADVSDTAWKALVHKTIVVEKTDGSSVSGELTAFDAAQVVVVIADGTPVVVDRKDVKNVRVQSSAGARASPAASKDAPAAQAPAASAAPAPEKKRKVVVNFNPLGNVISSIIIEGLDVTADAQFTISKTLALGIEPEIAIGWISGAGVWGGALFYPFATAPEGLFIKAYAGFGSFDGYGTFEALAACGYQFVWGGFVFSPELGVQYMGELGFHWRLDIGFAI